MASTLLALALTLALAAAELQITGISPASGPRAGGTTLSVQLAGVEPQDFSGFDSGFFLQWPTGKTSSRVRGVCD